MATTIYLDESGCLGWKLDAPYQRGGSSRHSLLLLQSFRMAAKRSSPVLYEAYTSDANVLLAAS